MKSHVSPGQAYVKPLLIQQMCQGLILEEEETKLFRRFFHKFLTLEFRMMISSTKRLKKKEKLAYFRIARRFLRHFLI
jgi:hypothetical protein